MILIIEISADNKYKNNMASHCYRNVKNMVQIENHREANGNCV